MNWEQKYKQLKVAIQDYFVELNISPADMQEFAEGTKGQPSMPSTKTASKLIDAGLLD